MKRASRTNQKILGLLFAATVAGSQGNLSAAGPAPVNLRSTVSFTILAGAAITTTGGGSINGDVGASPIAGSAIGATCVQVTGKIYAVDASGPPCAVIDASLLNTAKGDLTTAFNDAAGRTPIPSGPNLNPGLIPGSGNIGGMTLAPGLYKFTTTALISGTDVTLSGGPDDVWIFQCAQDLQLASGIKVLLAGGAQAKNIFWQVGTSAVLGTFSVFNGTILANQAITMGTSSTLTGRALAFSAGVTFNGNGAALPSTTSGVSVQQPPGTTLTSGVGTTSFGSVATATNSSLTFTITNSSAAALTGVGVLIDGVDSALFTVTTNPAVIVGTNASTTFTVQFAPLSTGTKNAVLLVTNAALNTAPFKINVSGGGTGGVIVSSTNILLIAVSPITLNPQTGLYEQTVRLTNASTGTVIVPTGTTGLPPVLTNPGTVSAIRLLIQLLPADVQVYYASGSTNGAPYVQWNFPLAPGATVDFTIEYFRPNRQTIPRPAFVAQETPAITLTVTGNTIPIDRFVQLGARYLVEYSAVPGRTYAMQYSTNLASWTTVIPTSVAAANRVQWYDDGPPQTQSKPSAVGSRFYRVVQLP